MTTTMTKNTLKFSVKRAALASVAAAPLFMALATPAQAQIVNTATVTGTPDSGTLAPVDAMESVTVALPIDAVNDTATGVNGATGDANVLNVLDDDTLNSLGVATTDVTITVATGSTVPAELTFDPSTGTVGVPAGTAAGTYTFDYTICETANPNNCDTATVSVTVDPSPIVATNDTVTGINGATGATGVLDLFDGDTVNNIDADPTNVNLTVPATTTGGQPNAVPAGLTLNPDGTVDVDPGTPAGTYTFEYQICETLNPTNCTTAVASVTVDPSPIVATNDTVTGINGATGATGVLDLFDGDTVNNIDADPTNVNLTVPATTTGGQPNAVPTGLTLNPDGTVDVDPGTPAGTYTFEYQICETLNPTNCTTAVASVTVDPSPIVPADDTTTVPAADATAGVTDVLNVFDGDLVNNATATTTNSTVTVATGSTVPPELTFDPSDGSIDVNPGTLAGDYSFDYTICETLNPTNCETATATVTVAAAPSLEMVKTADDTDFVTVGQVITYTYRVTNNGNVIIRGVSVSDTHNAAGAAPTPTNPQLTADNNTTGDSTDANSGDAVWDVLAPGDVIEFTGTYTVQQADIDNLQ